ncbi:MAG: primosomal protein N' [Pseudomonadota bacterium]
MDNPQTYPQVLQHLKEKQQDSDSTVPVAVDVPLPQTFDYRTSASMPAPGSRVLVNFARRKVTGLVWTKAISAKPHTGALKPIIDVLDAEPLVPESEMSLLAFAARYYHHPPGEVFAAAIPGLLRAGRDSSLHTKAWTLTPDGRNALCAAIVRRAPRQAEVLQALSDSDTPLAEDRLDDQLGSAWRRQRSPLERKGWIHPVTLKEIVSSTPGSPMPGLNLNQEQAAAVAHVRATSGFGAFLLDGITGSGKTEVYLSLIADVIERHAQVLLLVPEIGLTPQLALRLEQRLGIAPMLYHSELTEHQRARTWLAARDGSAALFLATRSGVFLPLRKPGLIVIDEEHDQSLKQHEGFRYHARDLAVWRAQQLDIPVILGTATPSFETLANAHDGRYQHIKLTKRAGDARPPTLSIIDMNRFQVHDGLAQPAIDAIRAHLERGKQVLVFINRRGYAPTLICTNCGKMAECPNCDAHLTIHRQQARLQCHHCGTRTEIPTSCDACGGVLKPLGEGTERVEDALTACFPEHAVARIDSDSTSGRGALEKTLEAARNGELSILIGTQMLAKGHHLPNVTLVVIVNLDQGFFANDLRASERLAQSLIQVAGRAGRSHEPGEVLIQTSFPHHPLLATLITSGYAAFADAALAERAQATWPPYSHLAVLHAAARDEHRAIAFLSAASRALARHPVQCLGPAPANMLRRRNRYRYRLLLQSDTRAPLQTALGDLTQWLASGNARHDVRWSLDIDPQQDI